MNNNTPPGWNDPPLVTTIETSKPKLLLNKRVPYPLLRPSGEATAARPPPINLIPLPSSIPLQSDSNNATISINRDILENVLGTVHKIIIDKQIESKKSEIIKRLEAMEELWMAGKLNEIVHEQIFKLTECLESGNISKANEIYVFLTVNYAVLCSTWLIGFKYILHHCKTL